MTLEEFIKTKVKEESKSCFECLTITEGALQKAQRYARLVAEELDGCECYGYLLAEPDDPRAIVTDVLLAPDQKARTNSVDVSSEAVLKAAEEIRQLGKRCLGFWHSHGRFQAFHSLIDDDNHEVVLGQLAPSNYLTMEAEDVLLEGDLSTAVEDGNKLTIAGANGVLELTLESGKIREPIKIAKVRLHAQEYVAFAYSLVVGCSEKTYAEVLVKRFGASSINDEMKRHKVKLNIICDDQEELLQEIQAKVSRDTTWSWGWGWSRGRDDEEDDRSWYRSQSQRGNRDW